MPFRILTFLAALAVSLPTSGQDSGQESTQDDNSNTGLTGPVVCVPNATGSGWLCTKDDGQTRPVLEPRVERIPDALIDSVIDAGNEIGEPAQEGDSETLEARRSSHHTMSDDPAGWYRPVQARPVQASHQMHEDLAAAMFVLREDAKDGLCSGNYLFREYPHSVEVSNEDFPIIAEADALTSVIDQDAALSGNVTIEQGNRLMVAPNAQLDQSTRVAEFPGGIRIDQPGIIMQGSEATVDLNSNEAELTDVQFILSDIGMRGEARF